MIGYKLYIYKHLAGAWILQAPVQFSYILKSGFQHAQTPTATNTVGFHFARPDELEKLMQSWMLGPYMLLIQIEASGVIVDQETCSRCETLRPLAIIPDEAQWTNRDYRAVVRALAYIYACKLDHPVSYEGLASTPPPLSERPKNRDNNVAVCV